MIERPARACTAVRIAVVRIAPSPGSRSWSDLGGLVLYCGGAKFLTQVGRDRGKVLEPTLYASWGGKPSVAMLRHSDTRLNAPTKNRYRAFLQVAVPTLALASPEEERTNPEAADDGYENANSWLLAQTMDRERFRLQFAENINYGFRRNVWALRPMGVLPGGNRYRRGWTGRSRVLDGRVLDYISRNRRRIVGEPCVHPRTHILLRAQDPRSVGFASQPRPSRGSFWQPAMFSRANAGLENWRLSINTLEAGIAVANRGTYTPAIDARLSIGFEV